MVTDTNSFTFLLVFRVPKSCAIAAFLDRTTGERREAHVPYYTEDERDAAYEEAWRRIGAGMSDDD